MQTRQFLPTVVDKLFIAAALVLAQTGTNAASDKCVDGTIAALNKGLSAFMATPGPYKWIQPASFKKSDFDISCDGESFSGLKTKVAAGISLTIKGKYSGPCDKKAKNFAFNEDYIATGAFKLEFAMRDDGFMTHKTAFVKPIDVPACGSFDKLNAMAEAIEVDVSYDLVNVFRDSLLQIVSPCKVKVSDVVTALTNKDVKMNPVTVTINDIRYKLEVGVSQLLKPEQITLGCMKDNKLVHIRIVGGLTAKWTATYDALTPSKSTCGNDGGNEVTSATIMADYEINYHAQIERATLNAFDVAFSPKGPKDCAAKHKFAMLTDMGNSLLDSLTNLGAWKSYTDMLTAAQAKSATSAIKA